MFLQTILILIYIVCPFFLQAKVYSYAISYSKPKYENNFKHFNYVNPKAPKGGTLRQIAYGSFNNLNPFILSGVAAADLGNTFETLGIRSLDETNTIYPLLAKEFHYDDKNKIFTVKLHSNAYFHNSQNVIAEDVIASFNILKKQGHPFYRQYYKNVLSAEKGGKYEVNFKLNPESNNTELPTIISQLPVLCKNQIIKMDFSKTTTTPVIGSGAYQIESFDLGKSITYKKNPNYWGRNLPVNVGRANFSTLKTIYYKDPTVALSAFKTHAHDIHFEYMAKNWATLYTGNNFTSGKIVREMLKDGNPAGMQAFVMNTRKSLFKDIKVRKALNYAFNFSWVNTNIFYNSYTRTNSYFANSKFAATKKPSGSEKEILLKYKNDIPEYVLSHDISIPDGVVDQGNRKNLIIAKNLLTSSGWHVEKNKLINNKTKKPFKFTILVTSEAMARVCLPYKESLEKLGITMNIKRISPSDWIRRIKKFDFEVTTYTWPQSNHPGNEQRLYWHSSSANIEGSDNLIGIQDPIVDKLVEGVIQAQDEESLVAYTKSLDRVLLWGYYVIPHWYLPSYRVSYWNNISRPKTHPLYGLDLSTWYSKEKQ